MYLTPWSPLSFQEMGLERNYGRMPPTRGLMGAPL